MSAKDPQLDPADDATSTSAPAERPDREPPGPDDRPIDLPPPVDDDGAPEGGPVGAPDVEARDGDEEHGVEGRGVEAAGGEGHGDQDHGEEPVGEHEGDVAEDSANPATLVVDVVALSVEPPLGGRGGDPDPAMSVEVEADAQEDGRSEAAGEAEVVDAAADGIDGAEGAGEAHHELPPPPPAPPRARRSGAAARRNLMRVTVVALLVAAATSLLAAVKTQEANDLAGDRDDRRALEDVAARFGAAYLSYDYAHPDRSARAVAALATSEFGTAYEAQRVPGIRELFSSRQTTTTADTSEVFVGSVRRSTARALVVVDVVAQSPDVGEQRLHDVAFVLDLDRTRRGWRVDEVARAPQPGLDAPASTTTTTAATSTSAPAG